MWEKRVSYIKFKLTKRIGYFLLYYVYLDILSETSWTNTTQQITQIFLIKNLLFFYIKSHIYLIYSHISYFIMMIDGILSQNKYGYRKVIRITHINSLGVSGLVWYIEIYGILFRTIILKNAWEDKIYVIKIYNKRSYTKLYFRII